MANKIMQEHRLSVVLDGDRILRDAGRVAYRVGSGPVLTSYPLTPIERRAARRSAENVSERDNRLVIVNADGTTRLEF